MKSKLLRTLINAVSLSLLILSGSTNTSAQQDVELKSAIAKAGYTVSKSASGGVLADWELNWKIVSKRTYSIVGKKPDKNARCGPETVGARCITPSFWVDVEDFASEADAQKRIDHIAATPPGPDSKFTAPEFDLREGFRIGTRVYVVGTGVYKFVADGSLTAFREKLKQLIVDFKPA